MASCMRMLGDMATGGSSKEQQAAAAPATSYALALWNLVIRPPRCSYDVRDLGPPIFEIDGMKGRRHDVRLRTDRGLHLECSYYRPEPVYTKGKAKQESLPVVIYLHGNSSSRLEALEVLRPLLAKRIALFCYDSAGCGMSQGEYVSLGHFEQEDLTCVIRHLRKTPGCGPIGLWGRSMGAATALLHKDVDRDVAAICSDSAFSSLSDVMWDLGRSEHYMIRCPEWLLSGVLAVMRMRVLSLAGFDVEDVAPLQHVKDRTVPAIFIHARKDHFIPVEHSRKLYAAYTGAKEFLEIGGDHNSPRGPRVIECCVEFFAKTLRGKSHHSKRAAPIKEDGTFALHWELAAPRATLPYPAGDCGRSRRESGERSVRKSKSGVIEPNKATSPHALSETKYVAGPSHPGHPELGPKPSPATAPPHRHIDLMRESSILSDGVSPRRPRAGAVDAAEAADRDLREAYVAAGPFPSPQRAALEETPAPCGGARNPSPWQPDFPDLALRGGGARNPSPWQPCFADNVYEDAPVPGDVVPADAGWALGELQSAPGAGADNTDKLVYGSGDDTEGKENVFRDESGYVGEAAVAFKPRKNALDRALDRAAAAIPLYKHEELLNDLQDATQLGIEEAPLCRMPAVTTVPLAWGPDCGLYPLPAGVADDPEVRPMPASSQPSLLRSCAAPAISPLREMTDDSSWAQPRHSQRHAAIGSPGTRIPKPHTSAKGRAKSGPRRLASQPWLCCGFTPVST